ncbi:MAG: MFS transporter [Candidatus Polarisedimenticolia bacterium]
MRERHALGILFLTLFLVMLGVGIIIPNLAYRAGELRATPFEIGLLFTLYSLMQFIFAPFWGRLSDRIGRKPVLLLGLMGNAAGLLLFAAAPGLPLLYAARGLSGLMSSAALPTAMAYVADLTDESGRGRGMGLMGAAMGLGFIFGPAIGGLLSRFGHAVPFLVAGALNAATCLLAALLLVESLATRPADAAPAARPALRSVFRSPLLPFYGVAFFVTFAMAALEAVFPLYLHDRFGLGAEAMGVMFLFMGTAVVAVQAGLLGRAIGALGEERVMFLGLWINALGLLLVTGAAGRTSLAAALVVSGVGNQIMRPANASLISKRATGGRGAAIGTMDAFDSAGRILGPLAASALYPLDPRAPYVASALILLAAASGLRMWRARAAEGPVPPQGEA